MINIYYINEYKQKKPLTELKVDTFLFCATCRRSYKFSNFNSALNAYKQNIEECAECQNLIT